MTTTRPLRSTTPTEVDVDLDALRAARDKPAKTFRLGGQTFTAPSSMPLYVGVLLTEGKQRDALRAWLGDEQEPRFSASGVTDADLGELFRALYGAEPAGQTP